MQPDRRERGKPDMTRLNLLAAAALVLGAFACDRSADKPGETHTTSAPTPANEPATPTTPTATPESMTGAASDTVMDGGLMRAARDAGLSTKPIHQPPH